MAVETIDEGASDRRSNSGTDGKVRTIRVAKPEEGDSTGELMHLLRSLALVIGAVALIGWIVT